MPTEAVPTTRQAAFNLQTYSANRKDGPQLQSYDAFDELGSSKADKLTSLIQASESKVASLRESAAKRLAERQVNESSWASQVSNDPNGVLGTAVNFGATLGESAARQVGQLVGAPALARAVSDEFVLSEAQIQAYNREVQGQLAQPGDAELLAQKNGTLASMQDKRSLFKRDALARSMDDMTARERLQRMDNDRQFGLDVKARTDLKRIVQKDRQEALNQGVGDVFDANKGQVKDGWNNGLTGTGDVLAGVAKMLGGVAAEIGNNKVAAAEIIVAQIPQIAMALMGRGGKAARVTSNMGYAAQAYAEGIAKYQAENGGAYPPEEMRRDMALHAASLAVAEQVGEASMLKGLLPKGAGKAMTSAAEDTARTSFIKSVLGPLKAGAGGVAGEGATEAWQTYAEGEAKLAPVTGREIFTGGVLGAVAGGGMASGGRALSQIVQTTPEDRQRQEQQVTEKANFAAAVAANDPSAFLDQKSPSHNPVKALSVLQANYDNADTTPEVKQANYQQAQTIVTDLDDQLEDAREAYAFARKSPEAKQAELAQVQEAQAQVDPADTARVAVYADMVATMEASMAPLTPAQARTMQADLSRMDRQLKDARTVKGRMVPLVTPEAFAEQVAAVQAAVDSQDAEAITASESAATSLINLSMASPELLTPEVAKQLSENTSSGLDDSQREYLRVFSEARIAQNALQDTDSVHQTILYGDKKNDQAGLVQHRERIGDAIEAGNEKAAQRSLTTLNNFAVDQANKAAAVTKALESKEVKAGQQVQIVKNRDTGQWEQYTGDVPLTEKERIANGGLNIHRGSGKIIGSIAAGATAISTAAAEMEAAYGLKFGNVSNKAKKTDTSAAPVQKTKESIQAPVAVTTPPKHSRIDDLQARVNSQFAAIEKEFLALDGSGTALTSEQTNRYQELEKQLDMLGDVSSIAQGDMVVKTWYDAVANLIGDSFTKEMFALREEPASTVQSAKPPTSPSIDKKVLEEEERVIPKVTPLAAEASQEATTQVAQPTTAQDVPTSPEFSKQADQNLEYLRNPPKDYTPAKATEIGTWAQSKIAALTQAMQDAGEDMDEADRLENLRSDMRWMVSKAKEMVESDTVLAEKLGPQGGPAKQASILTADPVAALAQANKHIADDAASAEPKLTGMKVREATAKEAAAYAPVVAEMVGLYPSTAGKASFLVHTGHRWKGGALSNPTDNQHIITILEDELTAFIADIKAGTPRIETLVVHELVHVADVQNIDQDGNWASNQIDALKFDGYQFMEAEAAARNIGEWIPKKDAAILRKHFGWVISKFKNDPAQSQREMYAQLQALYVVHPDLMEKYLGQTYAAYSGKPAVTGTAIPGTAETVSGNDGSTSPGLGETTQSQEPATDEPRVSGVAPEPVATGKLSILSRSAAEELPEGTLLGKVYQTINKAVAFLTQKEAKVEKDEDIAKVRPLVSTANFLSRWVADDVNVDPQAFFTEELNDSEKVALKTFKEYATKWSEVAKADFIKGSLPNGAGNKIREDYLFHDPVQDFINPDGSVDENLVTTVVTSAFFWLVDSLNNPARKLREGILTMHGLSEDDTLTSKGRDDLARFATMEDTAINSMGDILVDILGLQAGPNAPKDYLAKVSAAFGVHALRLLEEQGLIKRITLQKATLTEYMPDLMLPDYASISYVEIVRAGKEDKYALKGDSRTIRDSVVGSGTVLDRLFTSERSPAEASWTPIPFNQTKAKRTTQGISEKQHAIIAEAQQHENRIIPAMWTALQVLGDEVILQAAGKVEYDETKIQKENQDAVMAQNLNVENQLEGMKQLVQQAIDTSPLGILQAFFANHEVWRNFRVGITTRNMNLQTSKIHRFMFFRPEWASTIRMDEDDKVEHFKVALAAAFGIKTDQQPNAQTVEMFDAMLAKADNRIVDLTMKLHADIQNPGSPLLSQEEKSAIGALSAGKEGMQTLQALVALGNYLDALSQGKEDFTVHLLVGVDGKTNGPILSHLALGAASSVEELFKHMNRGGMFQKKGRFKNFSHWYQQATSLDLYEDLARVVLSKIPADMPNMEAFYVITKDLLHNGKVTSAGRKIVKTPLTSFAFGSTIEKSLQNMQQAFLQGVIDRIESVANDPAGSVSREKLIASINALIQMGGNRYAELLPKNASLEELMGMEFSKTQKKALEETFRTIMGEALETSMKEYFSVFMKRRDAVNGAIQTAYGVYSAIYQDLRNIELNRLMDSGDMGFTQTKAGREPWFDLTNAQEQALREKVADVLPRAHTAYTQGTDALKDGLMMAKSRRGVSQQPMHKVKAQLAQRFTDSKGKQVSHVDTRAMTTSENSPGVAGLPYFMHSLDSFIMHMSLRGTESLNVHDEAANGADKVTGTAKAINGATWAGMLNFSPATEAYEMLERSLINAVKLLESGDLSQASLALIKESFLRQIPKDIRNKVGTENIALMAMQMAKGHQYKAEQIRLGTLVQMGYLDQYTWEGGEYEVTPEDTAAAQTKLDALDKLMTYESDQAAEALGKAFKAGIKTKPVTVIVEADPTSSGMDDIDASDPNEETAATPVPTVLAGISPQELYAALPSTVSGTFDEHLRSLLDGMVSKLHGPFDSFKQAIMKSQPLGPLERMAKAQAEGKAPLMVSALTSGIKFSDQEAFVMEQVQATVKATLEANDGQTAIAYGELSKLFMEARKRIQPADFGTGDPVQDQAIHDFLFNHTDASKDDRSDYLARFAAVGLAHEGVNKLLQVETFRTVSVLKGERTIAAFLKRVFDSILEWFNGKLTNTQAGQKGNAKLMALVEQLVQIELKRQARVNDPAFDIVDAFDEKSKEFADGVAVQLAKIGKSDFFQKSRNNVLKASGSLVSMVAEDRVKWMVEGMNKFRDQYMDKEQGVIGAVFKDVVGFAAKQQVLLRMAVKQQGERKRIITSTTKLVRESFVNQGKDLTDKAKRTLTQVLLRTGAHVLLDQFDTVQLQKLLTDSKALATAIHAEEAKLSAFPAKFRNYFLAQSKDLAYFMVHSEAKSQHLMMNAGNIANMYETIHAGKMSEAQTQQATAIIDSLVSLYALSMSSTDSKTEVVTMLKAEHARTDGGNGVKMALLLQKNMEQEALERLFGNNPVLMAKGYTPEIYNPYTAVVVANDEEGHLLVLQGYQRGDIVQQDFDDPRKDAKRIYVLRDGGPPSLQTGIFSYTGTRHKGSTLHSGKDIRLQKQVLLAKQAAIDKLFEANPTYDPAKVKRTHMVPLLNALGQAVNYHYMMAAKTKDALLERNSRFDDVLGVQAGSVFDKATVGEQNKKAIQALKDMYLEDYKNNPQAYVQVGPTSPDAENRELYKLLPKVTQQDIMEIWGKEGLMVRRDHKDLYFGYHKLSLSAAWDKVDPTIAEKALVASVTWALENYAKHYLGMGPYRARQYAQRGAVVVCRGENIWQAVVREIKDIYVIKAVTSMLNNILSNQSLLYLHGVPMLDSLRYYQEAMRGVSDYERDTSALFKLEQEIKVGVSDPVKSQATLNELKDAIARNPVKPLIDAGLMPTIVEDVAADVDPFSYKSQFLRKTEKYTSKLNPGVRKAAKEGFMAHDTKIYQTLHHFTQLGDFMAQYALYQHLTTRKKDVMAHEEAIHEASESFVFYDIPQHRKMQYLEDMGLLLFTKYFMRIQRVLVGRIRENPGRVLTSILTHHYIGGLPGVMDASAIAHFGNWPLSAGALGFPGALPDLGTVQAMDGMLGILK